MTAKPIGQSWSEHHSTAFRGDVFKKDNAHVQTNKDVAKQMLGGSAWNGSGMIVYNGGALAGNFLRFVTNLVILAICAIPSIFSKTAREHALASLKKMGACVIFMGTNIKNIAYNAIRAVPIIGYPVSRALDKLAEKFYAIKGVDRAMKAMDTFGCAHAMKPRSGVVA